MTSSSPCSFLTPPRRDLYERNVWNYWVLKKEQGRMLTLGPNMVWRCITDKKKLISLLQLDFTSCEYTTLSSEVWLYK